jgi:hypothetical protein
MTRRRPAGKVQVQTALQKAAYSETARKAGKFLSIAAQGIG